MDPFHYRPQLKPEQEEPEPYITNPNIHNSTNKNHQNSSTSNNNYLCRQASTRWIPTSEQIRILRDLYYNYGIRSPNSDEIQRISAMLRQYGKIEGKNVFYWFQNHKARERHKKRFTVDVNNNGLINHQGHCNGLVPDAPVGLVRPHAGVSGPSSSGSFHGVAQQENSSYIGTMITERNFIVNGKGETSQMGTKSNNGGLALELELNTTNPWLLQRHADQQLASATIAVTRELETLQLFPVKTEIPFQSNLPTKQINNLRQEPSFHFPQFSNNSSFYYQQWQQNQEAANDQHLCEMQPSTTSLELTLGSYLFSPPM